MADDRQRQRMDEVFGTILPDTTSDERDPTEPEPDPDDWYNHNRPPHHDRDH